MTSIFFFSNYRRTVVIYDFEHFPSSPYSTYTSCFIRLNEIGILKTVEKLLAFPSSQALTLIDDRKIGATFTEEALVALSQLKIGKIVIVFLRTEKAEEQEVLSRIVADNNVVTENWNVNFEGNELSLERKHTTNIQMLNAIRITKKPTTRLERTELLDDTIKKSMIKPLEVMNSPVLNGNMYIPVIKTGFVKNIGLASKFR